MVGHSNLGKSHKPLSDMANQDQSTTDTHRDTSAKEVSSENDDLLMCTIQCHHGRKHLRSAPVIDCSICTGCFHRRCVGAEEHPGGFYACPTCRRISSKIDNINRVLCKQVVELTQMYQDKDKECFRLTQENANLRVRIAEMAAEVQTSAWQGHQNKLPENTLILSDSTTRDVDEEKLVRTELVCLRGTKVTEQELRGEIKLRADNGKKYKEVIIIAGTNDCSDGKEIQTVIDEYTSTIKEAKSISPNITVSSIVPRLDEAQEIVQIVNASLEAVCTEENCKFVNNTPSFTLGDGTVNDGYIINKGPHLT